MGKFKEIANLEMKRFKDICKKHHHVVEHRCIACGIPTSIFTNEDPSIYYQMNGIQCCYYNSKKYGQLCIECSCSNLLFDDDSYAIRVGTNLKKIELIILKNNEINARNTFNILIFKMNDIRFSDKKIDKRIKDSAIFMIGI